MQTVPKAFWNAQSQMHTDRKIRGKQTLWAVRWRREQINLCVQAPPRSRPVFLFPLQLASGVIALCWNSPATHTHTHKPPILPSPHPLPVSLACSRLVGIPTACGTVIWLMEFDFQRGSLKPVWLFGTVRMRGRGGKKSVVLGGQKCLARWRHSPAN